MQNTVDSASIPTVNNITNYMGYIKQHQLASCISRGENRKYPACRLPPSVGTAIWTSVGWWTL